MAEWWSIEVLNGDMPAQHWRDAYGSELIEAALTNGASDASWHIGPWGVAFEVCFATTEQWEAFRALPIVRGALDAVPDPVNGLLIYRGRGGTSAAGKPRRPRPAPSAASAALPEPAPDKLVDVTSITAPDLIGAGAAAVPVRYRTA